MQNRQLVIEKHKTSASAEERELLHHLGEARAVAVLGLPSSTLARIGAGWECRVATMCLFRARILEARRDGRLK